MKKLQYFSTALVGIALLSASSHAGTLKVINENEKSLSIKIEAEGDSGAISKREISAEANSSFLVNKTDLNGKGFYSIKGDTSAFTSGDKCSHLSVDKDYQVTFLNDTAGTTCVAKEITN